MLTAETVESHNIIVWQDIYRYMVKYFHWQMGLLGV